MAFTLHGHYRDGTPNEVATEINPIALDRTITTTTYATWIYRRLYSEQGFRWERIDPTPTTQLGAMRSIKAQCATWGIRYVKRQWTIVKTTTLVTSEPI